MSTWVTRYRWDIPKVAVLDDVTAQRWNEIKSAIVAEYKYDSKTINSDDVFTSVIGKDISADGFNNLRSYVLTWDSTIPQVTKNEDVTAHKINLLIDAIKRKSAYQVCTCNCAHSPCACNCAHSCRCNCDHCSCQCAHGCQCNCAYEGNNAVTP